VRNEPRAYFPPPVHAVVDAALEHQQRAAVIAAARTWIGTPYRQQGYTKGPQGAVDCSMLLVGALVEGRVFHPFDPRPYSPIWFLSQSEEKYLAWLDTIGAPTTDPKPGDIAVYKVGRCFAHSGVIADADYLVHAYASVGRCTLTERSWRDLAKRPTLYYDFWARLRG
jgi:cell wall-associated NlpC family hydrolase